MARWQVRFLAIVCLIGLLLSVAITSNTSVEASSTTCTSPRARPTVTGNPIVPSADKPSVVLNEILPFPYHGWNCSYQNSPGAPQSVWIELYNLLSQPVDLSQTCIDTGPNTSQYCLTAYSVSAHGFFTLFPYDTGDNWFPSAYSTLRLLMANTVVDQVGLPVPPLPRDVSYARVPDGTGKWQADTNPTINASNTIVLPPSPTPTHLHQRQESKSRATTQSRRKYSRNTGTGNADQIPQIITNTASNEQPQIQNNNGKQAQWHNLQFPSSLASASALTTNEEIHPTSSSPPVPIENIPQNILFSFIGIGGLLSVWWGWRRFFKKRL